MDRVAYIEPTPGPYLSPHRASAIKGLRGLAYNIHSLTSATVLPARPRIVGSMAAHRAAWHKANFPVPLLPYIPDALQGLADKEPARGMTLTEAMEEAKTTPLYVKPHWSHRKLFKAYGEANHITIKLMQDDLGLPGSTPVIVGKTLYFRSEWRLFILHRKVIGCVNYSGDLHTYPPLHHVEYHLDKAPVGAIPNAFVIDYGRCSDITWKIVECNEALYVGSYGLRPDLLGEFLHTRWNEIYHE